jgi:hypothetical protein
MFEIFQNYTYLGTIPTKSQSVFGAERIKIYNTLKNSGRIKVNKNCRKRYNKELMQLF